MKQAVVGYIAWALIAIAIIIQENPDGTSLTTGGHKALEWGAWMALAMMAYHTYLIFKHWPEIE